MLYKTNFLLLIPHSQYCFVNMDFSPFNHNTQI